MSCYLRRIVRTYREGWWLLCHRKATSLRGGWARYEADWQRDTSGHPMTATARQRRDLALAVAEFLEAIAGDRP